MASIRALILFFLLPALAAADALPSTVISPAEACEFNKLYRPNICRALLTKAHPRSTRFGYGHFSVKRALHQANHTYATLYRYALATGGDPSRRADDKVPRSAAEISHSLARLNAEYLAFIDSEMERGEAALDPAAAERVASLMNSVVTNQQTCSDMLEDDTDAAHPVQLLQQLKNRTRLYGVSLGLVTAALKQNEGGTAFVQSVQVNNRLVVSKDGSGDFTKIQDAVDAAFRYAAASRSCDGFIQIDITGGIYEENVVVTRFECMKLKFRGAGIDQTVITGSRSRDGNFQTYDTATFAVDGMGDLIAEDITFENTAGPEGMQAVAVRVSGDVAAFYRCSFLGYQDTLFADVGRQFYGECHIYGTIDFIFGNAVALLLNSMIHVRRPLQGQYNVVTAQGRMEQSTFTGFSIHNCTIQPTPELANGPPVDTYLGRPWKQYSTTVVMESYIDGLVNKEGWKEWDGDWGLSTLYYGEYRNTGPGADTGGRVQWPGYKGELSYDAASQFTVQQFLQGTAPWLKMANIPIDPSTLSD